MKKFAVNERFAVPVDDITGIIIKEEKQTDMGRIPGFGWLFGYISFPARMVVRTRYENYYIEDSEEATKLLQSLSASTNIDGAYIDDLYRGINENLS
jgi:hypothetical protein